MFSITKLIWITYMVLLVGAQPTKPLYSQNEDIDERDLQCAVCLAIADVVDNSLSKKSFDGVESRVIEVFEDLCDQKNFRSYDFIPPTMAVACTQFLDDVDEDKMIQEFVRHYTSKVASKKSIMERQLCVKLSPYCINNKRIDHHKEEFKSVPKVHKTSPEEDRVFDGDIEELIKQNEGVLKKPEVVKTEL